MPGHDSGNSAQRHALIAAIISGVRIILTICVRIAAHYINGSSDDREGLSRFNNKSASIHGRVPVILVWLASDTHHSNVTILHITHAMDRYILTQLPRFARANNRALAVPGIVISKSL